jgi:hypothetical protein
MSGCVVHSSWGWTSGKTYEALSYVWGDVRDSIPILVDGHPVSVTKSLESAVRHLRYPDKPRTLWVDYICINQEDILERSELVAKLGSIYENADSVLIWLGLPSLRSTSPRSNTLLSSYQQTKSPSRKREASLHSSRRASSSKLCLSKKAMHQHSANSRSKTPIRKSKSGDFPSIGIDILTRSITTSQATQKCSNLSHSHPQLRKPYIIQERCTLACTNHARYAETNLPPNHPPIQPMLSPSHPPFLPRPIHLTPLSSSILQNAPFPPTSHRRRQRSYWRGHTKH